MSPERFALELLTLVRLRARLPELPWEIRREAQEWLREREASLRSLPGYWERLYEFLPAHPA